MALVTPPVVMTMTRSVAALAVVVLCAAAPLVRIATAGEGGSMLEPGAKLPTFTLTAHDGSTVHSADLAGKPYLLYFYPKADTPGCTREACELRDRWEDLQAAGLTVLGVSFDSPKKNHDFAAKYKLPFLLLSDEDQVLAKAVGATSLLLPFPKRISYLVSGDGTVLKAYPKVVPADHAGEVLRDLRAVSGS
jgi:peroxiredoxin Q/BCP